MKGSAILKEEVEKKEKLNQTYLILYTLLVAFNQNLDITYKGIAFFIFLLYLYTAIQYQIIITMPNGISFHKLTAFRIFKIRLSTDLEISLPPLIIPLIPISMKETSLFSDFSDITINFDPISFNLLKIKQIEAVNISAFYSSLWFSTSIFLYSLSVLGVGMGILITFGSNVLSFDFNSFVFKILLSIMISVVASLLIGYAMEQSLSINNKQIHTSTLESNELQENETFSVTKSNSSEEKKKITGSRYGSNPVKY